MTEFVGRTGSLRLYSYPERRRSGAELFARNFAAGPEFPTPVAIATDPGTQVPWAVIESGAPAGVNVPITPRSSGIIRITGVVVVKSSSEIVEIVNLEVEINGTAISIPQFEAQSILDGGFATIPFVTENTSFLPIGVVANVSVRVTASSDDVLQLRPASSTIDVQEVPAATG
jgi:hypothetical protein